MRSSNVLLRLVASSRKVATDESYAHQRRATKKIWCNSHHPDSHLVRRDCNRVTLCYCLSPLSSYYNSLLSSSHPIPSRSSLFPSHRFALVPPLDQRTPRTLVRCVLSHIHSSFVPNTVVKSSTSALLQRCRWGTIMVILDAITCNSFESAHSKECLR